MSLLALPPIITFCFLSKIMSNVFFTCTALAGTNKQGILKPDANGYYIQPVGGMNVHNSAGHLYTAEPAALKLFEQSSSFMRRVRDGALRAEVDHPQQLPGMTDEEYEIRMLTIDPKNECAHFADIWLDFKNYKNQDGTPIVAIMAKVAPSGVHGEMLRQKYANPHENVCFSIRAFTMDRYESGLRKRVLAEIVNFDYVNEPGIHIAKKFLAPGLESRVERVVTRESLARMEANAHRKTLIMGVESATVDFAGLQRTFGWDMNKKPGFFGWNG